MELSRLDFKNWTPTPAAVERRLERNEAVAFHAGKPDAARPWTGVFALVGRVTVSAVAVIDAQAIAGADQPELHRVPVQARQEFERMQPFGLLPTPAVRLHVVGEHRVEEHGHVAEEVVEHVGLDDVVEFLGLAQPDRHREAPVGEVGEEGLEVALAADRESTLAQLRRLEPPVVTMDLDPHEAMLFYRLLDQPEHPAPVALVELYTTPLKLRYCRWNGSAWAESVIDDNLNIFAAALLVQREVGGNLSQLLGNLAETIRERFRINQEVKAEMPIAETIYRILWQQLSPSKGFQLIEETLI